MRILLVDDHQLVRQALSHYLKFGDASIDVIEAGSLNDVVRHGYHAPFDVVLLDYRLPGTSGDAAIVAIRQLFPQTPVIVLSGAITREEARSALVRGAAGVISKDIEGRRLLQTIRDIIGGEVQIFGLAEPSAFPPPIPVAAAQEHGRAANLSNREAQVARLLVEGLSNKEIAKALGIAEITVRLHLRRVFHKVGARSRTDAVRIILMSAADAGAAPPGSLAARRRRGG
ncbi:MAG TPA: response regulator transcription factor [Stellaceae bacterium]|nr:response regulator transcription factor [Stellaceae bacterium]